MSKYTPTQTVSHKFVQEDFDRLLANRVSFYLVEEDSPRKRGALVRLVTDSAEALLDEYVTKINEGYTRSTDAHVTCERYGGIGHFAVTMLKPQQQQDEDIAAIRAEVEESYTAELKARYDLHLAAMISETVSREETAQRKKEEQAKQKLIDKARSEALAVLGEFQ
ncbi:hypothetical protein PH586_17875 [Pseudomonas sp. SA3-5]|uniref:Uncharacterized protein n=1 Tax=Pseudomonas aestuarii TaxID=3018340 RepID=A0ABT4XJC4_9PSED|nr:hypothetical protein [Pseudomonas aestuarii]MDA7088257.1 hypothetical protein [Pseudomonas aestuarii]